MPCVGCLSAAVPQQPLLCRGSPCIRSLRIFSKLQAAWRCPLLTIPPYLIDKPQSQADCQPLVWNLFLSGLPVWCSGKRKAP